MKTTSYEFLILKLFGTKNNSIISCQKMVSIHQLISYLTCLLSILINIYNLWNTYIHWIYSILVYTHLRTHNILILLVGFQIDWWDRMEWQKENWTFMNRCLRELPTASTKSSRYYIWATLLWHQWKNELKENRYFCQSRLNKAWRLFQCFLFLKSIS